MNLDQKLQKEHKERVYIFVYHAWFWTFSLPFILALIIASIGSFDIWYESLFDFLKIILYSFIIGILSGIPFLLFFRILAYFTFRFRLSVKARFWTLFTAGLGFLFFGFFIISFIFGLPPAFNYVGAAIWLLLFLILVFVIFTWKNRRLFFDYAELDANSDDDDILDAPLKKM